MEQGTRVTLEPRPGHSSLILRLFICKQGHPVIFPIAVSRNPVGKVLAQRRLSMTQTADLSLPGMELERKYSSSGFKSYDKHALSESHVC